MVSEITCGKGLETICREHHLDKHQVQAAGYHVTGLMEKKAFANQQRVTTLVLQKKKELFWNISRMV